jgi:hypothetical protein
MFPKSIVSALLLASSAVALTIDSVVPSTLTPGASVVISFTADVPSSVSKALERLYAQHD